MREEAKKSPPLLGANGKSGGGGAVCNLVPKGLILLSMGKARDASSSFSQTRFFFVRVVAC